MKTQLSWKKGIFSSTCHIHSADSKVGELKEKSFSGAAEGKLNGKRYEFKTKGFFKPETQIIAIDYHVIVGTITYGNWRTKATIEVDDTLYEWEYSNSWHTKWRILNAGETLLDYHGSSSKGKINGGQVPDFLILSGLYITNYYWRVALAVMVAIMVPVIAS
jgi:hypothetical protein